MSKLDELHRKIIEALSQTNDEARIIILLKRLDKINKLRLASQI